jgi:hypothetical protein
MLLGPAIEHRDGLNALFRGKVDDVRWVPDSSTYLSDKRQTRLQRLGRQVAPLFGTRHRGYLDMVLRSLDEQETQVLLAYWGTLPLADVQAIKRARPSLKIVLMVLCYPLALTTMGVLRQRISMQCAAPFLDGVLCPTQDMVDYLFANDLAGSRLPVTTLPPCWPRAFFTGRFADPVSDPVSDRPNIVYVGRTDLSGPTVHVGDDLRPLMSQLLEGGIELHHAYSRETDDGHPLRRPFTPVPVPELMGKMSAYDASLIAYNVAACPRPERFQLTVPDRLITSVAAGVPIAIPRQGYQASKNYLSDYPAMIEFDTATELYAFLSDRSHVQELRTAAWKARWNYTAEGQAQHVLPFLSAMATSRRPAHAVSLT